MEHYYTKCCSMGCRTQTSLGLLLSYLEEGDPPGWPNQSLICQFLAATHVYLFSKSIPACQP